MHLRASGLALLSGLVAGCASSPRIAAAPVPAATVEPSARVEAIAGLLRLEDRREFDRESLAGYAAVAATPVRRRAALAIGRIRDPRGRDLLVHLLTDADTAVAATAAFSLGHLGDTLAVAPLAARLAAPGTRPTVASEAAAALGRLATVPARNALEGFLNLPRPGPASAVGEALLAIWRTPRGGDLAPILRWVRSADPELRWRATYALSRRADPRATATLLDLASDADARVRAFALRGLTAPLADSAGIGAPRAAARLQAAAQDPDPGVRVSALRALGTHRDSSSVAVLARAVGEPDPWIAVSAAEALGRLGSAAASAAPSLRTAADSPGSPSIRVAALSALARVAPEQAEPSAAAFAQSPIWRLRAAAAQAYGTVGSVDRPEIKLLIRDRDPRVAAAALDAAVSAAGESVAVLRTDLIDRLAASDPFVRTAALNGLAILKDPATLPLLLDAYARAEADTVNDAQLAAINALGALQETGTGAATGFVARFRRSSDYLVRQRAAEALGPAVLSTWGEPFPVETGRELADYRRIAERWIAPRLAGAAPPRIRIETDSGQIELALFAADAPMTVDNFVRLAESGFFDGQEWPRVVANFVIQGGDPRGDTNGGPGYAIRDEINRNRYAPGALGMALSGPDTGGSQWFITHSPQPHLDGGYTVFGQTVSGTETARKLQVGDRIHRIVVLP